MNEKNSLLIIIVFVNFLVLSNFSSLVIGQSFSLTGHSAILINDKIYYFGGNSGDKSDPGPTNQIFLLDMTTYHRLENQTSFSPPTFELVSPKMMMKARSSYPPPFENAALELITSKEQQTNNNKTLIYLIGGYRNQNYGGYGPFVYSVNAVEPFSYWTPLSVLGIT